MDCKVDIRNEENKRYYLGYTLNISEIVYW